MSGGKRISIISPVQKELELERAALVVSTARLSALR
jgi:hypothetical protein